MTSRRTLIVFARAPELGRVKTRLAADVGAHAALAIYRHLGQHTLRIARAVRDCAIRVAYTPEEDGDAAREWLGADVTLTPQASGDLGRRMALAAGDALAAGTEQVVIVGTDCPALDADVIDAAFSQLAAADVVLGPASDGGYYLIGIRRVHPALFDKIPWSTPETLSATLRAASAAGLRVTLLDPRSDIDTGADWLAWLRSRPADERARLQRVGLDPSAPAPHDR